MNICSGFVFVFLFFSWCVYVWMHHKHSVPILFIIEVSCSDLISFRENNMRNMRGTFPYWHTNWRSHREIPASLKDQNIMVLFIYTSEECCLPIWSRFRRKEIGPCSPNISLFLKYCTNIYWFNYHFTIIYIDMLDFWQTVIVVMLNKSCCWI